MTLITQHARAARARFQDTELMRIVFYLSEVCIYQDITETGKTRYFTYHHHYFENTVDYGLSKSCIIRYK